MPNVPPVAVAVNWSSEISMTQLPRPIGMPASEAVYSASSRPCAAATWAASIAKAAMTKPAPAPTARPAFRMSGFSRMFTAAAGPWRLRKWLSAERPKRAAAGLTAASDSVDTSHCLVGECVVSVFCAAGGMVLARPLDAFRHAHYRSASFSPHVAAWPPFGAGRAEVLSGCFERNPSHVTALRAHRQDPADRE